MSSPSPLSAVPPTETPTGLGVDVGGTFTDTAIVKGAGGELVVPVELTEDIRRGVLSLPHGWGHSRAGTGQSLAASRPGVNANQLNDGSVLDPLSGTAVLNGIPVLVGPAVGPAA